MGNCSKKKKELYFGLILKNLYVIIINLFMKPKTNCYKNSII